MSMVITFADWLKNYSNHDYREATVKQYIRSLECVPEMIGLTLSKPILEYTVVDEFSSLYETIISTEKFSEINRNYNHGSISAALSAFKRYTLFLEKVASVNSNERIYSPQWFYDGAQSKELKAFEQEAVTLRQDFCSRFGVAQISALSGKDLLTHLFYSGTENKDSLCYILEFHPKIRGVFGSIVGGSAFKYGLFYHQKKHCWMTGSPTKPKALTEEEAIKVATEIRDNLVAGAKVIEAHGVLDSVADYEKLYAELQNIDGIDTVWVLKYYQMLYPDVLPTFYSKDFQIKVVQFLRQEPSSIPFVRMGQISLFIRKCGISSPVFGRIYHDTYFSLLEDPVNEGGEDIVDALADAKEETVRYWLYAPGEGSYLWDEYREKGIMAIGWGFIGDLRNFQSKADMKQKMKELDDPTLSYTNAAHATWQFANEMKVGDVIFVKKGISKIIGKGIVASEYEFDDTTDTEYKNIRHVHWTHNGEWPHPGQAVMKTLTDITPYTDYVEKLSSLFVNENEDDEEEQTVAYPAYSEADFLNDVYMDEDEYVVLVDLIRNKKNVILQGAPGVGKTYAAKRLAYSMMGVKDQNRVMMIQFHQSYSYEDFIMGFRPSETGFELRKGVFYNFCKKAEIDSDNAYFFIIDEINRGNLSKIFGELFMLIESDKRDIQLQLLYSDEKFAVPKNVYIIGMMNTADRSLAMLDYALRRRFAFYEMVPGFDTDGFRGYRMGLGNDKFDKLIQCVENLNAVIAADDSLGEGFCIGHSYFCNQTPESITDRKLSGIVEYELIPLLKEYWFDEPLKVKDWTNNLRSAIK